MSPIPTVRMITIASLLLALAGLVQAQTPVKDLDAYVRRILPDWEVPGLAIAVVSKGELVFAKGYGIRALATDDPVDEHTLFSIGSTTKAMTAAIIGTLVDDGKLGWDDAVTRHWPAFQLSDPYVTREITIRDLLTHRAGLGNADGLWYGSDRTRAQILASVPLIPLVCSLRAGFVYQNVMYLAAGELSALVARKPWEELMSARLFTPLGMDRTVATTTAAQALQNVARPHARIDDVIERIENENLDSIAPAGAVWSSVEEMSRWMRMLLAEGEFAGSRVLSQAVVAEMFTPQTLIRNGLYPYLHLLEPHWNSYGLGWFQLDYEGRAVSFHTGSIDGMSAMVGLIPDEDFGVVVLANLDHAELRHALLWKTIDLFGGKRNGRDWSRELHALYTERAAACEEAVRTREAARQAGTKPSLVAAQYAGEYVNDLNIDARVSEVAGKLRLTLGPRLAGTLEHWHHETFLVRFDRRWHGETLLTFALNARGAPASFEMNGVSFEHRAD